MYQKNRPPPKTRAARTALEKSASSVRSLQLQGLSSTAERIGRREAAAITGLSRRIIQSRWREIPGSGQIFSKITFDEQALRRWVEDQCRAA